MNFSIDHSSQHSIVKSFDRIAEDLLLQKQIIVNETAVNITEIEFYYFKSGVHEDNYTHIHDRNAGEWRYHRSGIDITFQASDQEQTDGGILIRGIELSGEYINGPIKSLRALFALMGKVNTKTNFQLTNKEKEQKSIIKTFRHLPNKIRHEKFHHLKYRYIVELDKTDISSKIKDQIRKNSERLKTV